MALSTQEDSLVCDRSRPQARRVSRPAAAPSTPLTDLDHPDADTVRAKLHDLDRTPTSNDS
jgi:hypothetical protein